MWEWKESVEHCFFTNHLDEQLKEFLNIQKVFSSDAEQWEFIHKNAYEWERKCSANFDEIMMPSFWGQWNISAHWGEFSFPATNSYTLEETLYWIFLTGWILIEEYDRKDCKGNRTPEVPPIGLEWLLREQFQYPLETCTWLNKQQFLEEIREIYNHSLSIIRSTKRMIIPHGYVVWRQIAPDFLSIIHSAKSV